ncbi:MAG: permease-like cell division protein FtsX [Eubacterium sp.]|nr:permease-like cell division protein FtsX [Eubacterium sp.]
MRISTFFYSLRQGVKNIWRNKMFSLASIATMTACIFLFGLFFAIVTNFQSMVKDAEEGVAVTVLFDDTITPQQIAEIGERIKVRPEVSAYNFKSADDAWAEFSEIYFEGNEELAEGFGDDNPLQKSESYEIYLNDVSMQDSLVVYLENLDGVREVRRSEIVANTLSDFNRLIGYVSAGIILILICVAVFLISNTVTVGIAVRKEEIAIMKLIGATDFFVRAPFVVEGILIGLIGSIVPLALLYVMYSRLIVYITDKFNFLSGLLNFLPEEAVFQTLTPVGLALGVGIGFLGSFLTIRKHLKV